MSVVSEAYPIPSEAGQLDGLFTEDSLNRILETSGFFPDGVLAGNGPWGEVKPCVRNAFMSLYGVFRAQCQVIAQLELQLQQRMQEGQIQALLNKKCSFSQVNAMMHKVKVETDTRLNDLDRRVVSLEETTEKRSAETEAALVKMKSLRRRVDEVHEELEKNRSEVETQTRRMARFMEKTSELLVSEVAQCTDKVDSFAKELSLKAGMNEVCQLLRAKPDFEDIQRNFASRVSVEDLPSMVSDVLRSTLGQVLNPSVGRWLWTSGKPRGKHGAPGTHTAAEGGPAVRGAVPWSAQTVNSDPHNFRWTKDVSSIRVEVGGLYEVNFGIYSKSKPSIQLLVDGRCVITALNSMSYVMHHSSGRLVSTNDYTSSTITGLTAIDFLSLPPKCKISLYYEGKDVAKGFLCLKKL